MRTSILLIRKHGKEAFELLAGPDVPVNEQEKEFREALTCNRVHPEIAELQRWDSDGGLQRTEKFEKPEVAKSRKEKEKKDFDDHSERQKPKKAEKPVKGAPKTDGPAPATTETPQPAEQPATDAANVDL